MVVTIYFTNRWNTVVMQTHFYLTQITQNIYQVHNQQVCDFAPFDAHNNRMVLYDWRSSATREHYLVVHRYDDSYTILKTWTTIVDIINRNVCSYIGFWNGCEYVYKNRNFKGTPLPSCNTCKHVQRFKQEAPEGPGSLTWGKGQRSQWSHIQRTTNVVLQILVEDL